jgi:hypothetical protein
MHPCLQMRWMDLGEDGSCKYLLGGSNCKMQLLGPMAKLQLHMAATALCLTWCKGAIPQHGVLGMPDRSLVTVAISHNPNPPPPLPFPTQSCVQDQGSEGRCPGGVHGV